MKELCFLFVVLSLMCLTSCQAVTDLFQGLNITATALAGAMGMALYTAVKFLSRGE